MVPNLALGATFVNFWLILGSPGLHFGLILVPFLARKAPILVPTAYVLEFLDNLFLEQKTHRTQTAVLGIHGLCSKIP